MRDAVVAGWPKAGSVPPWKGREWAPISGSLAGNGCSRAARGGWSRATRLSRLASGRESAATGELEGAEGAGWPGLGVTSPEKVGACAAAGSRQAVSGSLLWSSPARQAARREARSTLWAGCNPRKASRCATTLRKRGYRGKEVRCWCEKIRNGAEDIRRFFEVRFAIFLDL